MLTSDLQNLEGCSLVRVQPSYNLHQNVMRFNVPHMRGTLNHIFHMRRLKSDPITKWAEREYACFIDYDR